MPSKATTVRPYTGKSVGAYYRQGKKNRAYYNSPAWRELRAKVRQRDHGICQYCGREGHQADHVIPRSKSGPDTLENLVCCCHACNKAAGAKYFPTFEAKRTWILTHRRITMRPILTPNKREERVPVILPPTPPQSRLRDRLKAKRAAEKATLH